MVWEGECGVRWGLCERNLSLGFLVRGEVGVGGW